MLAQECVCKALAGPCCLHCKITSSSCPEKEVGRGKHLPQAPALHIPVWQNPVVQAVFPEERNILASAALFANLLPSFLSKTFSMALHVQKNVTDSFTFVFFPILVLCGTDTFKEPPSSRCILRRSYRSGHHWTMITPKCWEI